MAETVILTGPDGTDYSFPGVSKVSVRKAGGGRAEYSSGGSNSALIGVLDGTITQLTADDLSGITEIRDNALVYCENLMSITFPEGLRKVGNWACEGCTALTTVVFPDSLIEINNYAFSGCESLAFVTWGSGIEIIDSYAFSGCSFSSVSLPGVVEIHGESFGGLRNLAHVTIGADCTLIDYQAFVLCTSLVDVTIAAAAPPTLDVSYLPYSLPFYGCSSLSAIYVPLPSVAAYKAASGWSSYASIIQAIPE